MNSLEILKPAFPVLKAYTHNMHTFDVLHILSSGF